MRNNKEIQTDRYIAKRQMLFAPFARQNLQDYFEGKSEFYLEINFYLFNVFSRDPSRYSA